MVQTVRILKTIGEAVMFRHTLFSLPFVATAVLLESGGHPPVNKTILIFLAAAAARNAANALNRVIDAAIDGRNPRTAHRHLPQRALSKKALLIFALVMGGILTVCAALLGPLCVILLPPACILIAGYSFSKRFTCLCHYWLGAACACAPMGAFIALSGHLALRYIVLAAAHALWVAGFDILYAIQDIAFDRREDLHSIPARFGAARARICAILSHLGTLTGLFLVPRFWPVSTIYLSSVCAAAALLAAEHLIALGKTERHIRVASYSINEILPLVILAGTVADFWLR
jgi:4-hydroxybenzoate polyprenyltransferase